MISNPKALDLPRCVCLIEDSKAMFWFSESFKKKRREKKNREEKLRERKKRRKIKNIFKINKLFLYITSNSFDLFYHLI